MIYLTKEQLEKLTTKRLLAYKRKNWPYNGCYYYDCEGDCKTCKRLDDHMHYYYSVLKPILDKREHIKRKL